uniref:Nas2 N-terminal domain-containing protein n=1 Tax=Tetradesmus obliquus TaxID=3088 RepID=A0A383VU54_TETOB|eukprot:jgi/Sobl393_1/4530/SZX67926.1
MEALKAELKQLQAQRSAIEAEIKERSDRLNDPGQPGMNGSLLDKEGFPRSDIDIHAVRSDRNAVIRLANDHKHLSSRLEQLLHKMHAAWHGGCMSRRATLHVQQMCYAGRETGAVAAAGNSQPAGNGAAAAAAAAVAAVSTSAVQQQDTKMPQASETPAAAAAAADVALRPFAVVDEVADGSPAAAAGIQLGDQLCRFGAAMAGSGSELQQVAQELQAHENKAVQVVFLRAGQAVQMQLVPQKWAGRGLLGCHLRPL